MGALNKDEKFLLPADDAGRKMMKKRLEEKYGFLNTFLLTKSILSRAIEGYKIGKGKRCVFIVGTHHAMESITANLSFLLIDYLLANADSGNVKGVNCKLLLSKYSFIIIPCLNPDGVELRLHGVSDTPLKQRQMRMSGGDFTAWQANARGVDLNHNYDYRFFEYKAIERERGILAGATLFSGEFPESEPESRAVGNLVRTIAPVAVVALHAQGEEIYAYPRVPHVERAARRLSALSGYSLGEPTDTAAYGGLCDYTGAMGIPSFTYEVGKGQNPLPEDTVYAIFERVADSIVLLPTFL